MSAYSSKKSSRKAASSSWWISQFLTIALFFGAGILLIVILGVAQRFGWIGGSSGETAVASEAASETIYTCPMHPQIRQNSPGRCPICGMKLVEAAAKGADLDQLAVTIEPAQRRLANIQTAEVVEKPASTTIQTIGEIQIDESRQATIAAYIDGRVERLFADYTGVEVEQGDHLAIVYSPQLFSAQVEFLEARKTLEKTSNSGLQAVREAQQKLVENSRQKLIELGMTDEQIAELEKTNEPQSRLTIYSPIGGTVTEKLTEEGKYISAGEPIYRVANLSTIWLMLELYPEDASRVRFGQFVEAELTSQPGRKLEGRIAFIDPTVDEQNRTVGVRVEFKNPKGELRPGDYAQATIQIPIGPQGEVYDEGLAGKWISPMHPQVIEDEPGDCPICGMKLVPTERYGYTDQPVPQETSLIVPRSAILMAGEHSVVYVETEPGRFEIRNVTLGPILRDEAVILEGVEAGEKVATSGNFLIDSQMQLAGKPSVINPTKYKPKSSQDYRNKPLEFDNIQMTRLEGETGLKLENLYQSYFDIQKALASDRKPEKTEVETLVTNAVDLEAQDKLSPAQKDLLTAIETNAAHLHHVSIDEARVKFKPISHAVVTLSTQLRGEQAQRSFYQFFCPMVKEGEGDWLQADETLINPYFGSQMLSCGELVRTIPPDADAESHAEHDHQHEPTKEEK
ncbi:MAG: efflux RND transporter periplasmic adaptor subunit [Planctomycetaceae bacterium]|nr:efflux RND transporter periplasmic adaptor subunit [Planctomycetaceae bacterium]